MQHSDEQIERAAQRFERLADELDPASVEAEHTDDLRSIATAAEAVRADEAQLRNAVEAAYFHEIVIPTGSGPPAVHAHQVQE